MAFLIEKSNGSSIELTGGLEVENCIMRFVTSFDYFGEFYSVNIAFAKDQIVRNFIPKPSDLGILENIPFTISNEDYLLLNPIEVHNRVKAWFERTYPQYKLTIV
jgi:hypothetical protein